MNRDKIDLKIKTKLELKLKPVQEILETHGMNPGGRVQRVIDSEVLRLDDPYVPFDTGNLRQSGIRRTHFGSGEVVYNVVYAASQYYNTPDTRSYDPIRGAHWFERMKADHHGAILDAARKAAKE